jgi:putative holliday junction resolvase
VFKIGDYFVIGVFLCHFIYLCGMARILAIDYGEKRTGIAVSDPLQIIATPLDTVATKDFIDFLKKYLSEETVETIVFGEPMHLNGDAAAIMPKIELLAAQVQTLYPEMRIEWQDERYTSRDATRAIMASGAKKKTRQDKALVDRVSAAIILQTFMEKNNNKL